MQMQNISEWRSSSLTSHCFCVVLIIENVWRSGIKITVQIGIESPTSDECHTSKSGLDTDIGFDWSHLCFIISRLTLSAHQRRDWVQVLTRLVCLTHTEWEQAVLSHQPFDPNFHRLTVLSTRRHRHILVDTSEVFRFGTRHCLCTRG